MPLSDKISISSGICGASSVVDAKRIEKLNHIVCNFFNCFVKDQTLLGYCGFYSFKMNEKSQYKTMQIDLVIYL